MNFACRRIARSLEIRQIPLTADLGCEEQSLQHQEGRRVEYVGPGVHHRESLGRRVFVLGMCSPSYHCLEQPQNWLYLRGVLALGRHSKLAVDSPADFIWTCLFDIPDIHSIPCRKLTGSDGWKRRRYLHFRGRCFLKHAIAPV